MDKNVNALMDSWTYERLRDASHEERKSMSEIIREALALWFERRDDPRRTVLVGDTCETPENAAQYAADEAEALGEVVPEQGA